MTLLLGLAAAAVAACAAFVVAAVVLVRRGAAPTDVAGFVPSLARLSFRLLRDRSIPLRVRARLLIAVAYTAQPINLIPDFVPVIGFADNLIIFGWALKSTVQRAGRDAIVRHWSGSEAGLVAVFRLAGLEERKGA
jgi:uncharacterized membrane protein YkvA (DUF1232 family)